MIEGPVAGGKARGRRNETLALVEPDCFEVDAGLTCELADAHLLHRCECITRSELRVKRTQHFRARLRADFMSATSCLAAVVCQCDEAIRGEPSACYCSRRWASRVVRRRQQRWPALLCSASQLSSKKVPANLIAGIGFVLLIIGFALFLQSLGSGGGLVAASIMLIGVFCMAVAILFAIMRN